MLLELRVHGKGEQSLGEAPRQRERGRTWSCAKGPPQWHPQFLAAMTTDKATPPSAMAVAPKSHFQGMDCGAEQ